MIDSVKDYSEYMQEIFDFPAIKSFIKEKSFTVLITALNGGENDDVAGDRSIWCRLIPLWSGTE